MQGAEVACIDDSDCAQLGHKYVCYLYSCLNWVDQTPCTGLHGSSQCQEGQQCHRVTGWYEDVTICVERPHRCHQHSDCGDQLCCKDSCCPLQFFQQWTKFRKVDRPDSNILTSHCSCVTDQQCQEWKTGESCCEGGHCCHSCP